MDKDLNYIKIKSDVLNYITTDLQRITPSNITKIITFTVEKIEEILKKTDGADKKEMCMSIVYDIITNSNNTIDKDYTLSLVNNIIDPLIENIIDLSKGKYNINSSINIIKKIFGCCIQK